LTPLPRRRLAMLVGGDNPPLDEIAQVLLSQPRAG